MKWLIVVVCLLVFLDGCALRNMPKPTPVLPPSVVTGTPSPGPLVPNDSLVTAQIVSVMASVAPFTWQAELRLLDSQNVTGYVNLTKEKVGQTLLVNTKEDMAGYSQGDTITGNLRVAGDENGTLLILLNISKK